jgi:hypothetical protein
MNNFNDWALIIQLWEGLGQNLWRYSEYMTLRRLVRDAIFIPEWLPTGLEILDHWFGLMGWIEQGSIPLLEHG